MKELNDHEAAKEIDRLRRRVMECDALLSVLLRDECVAEHARESLIEQMQDNRKALEQ